MLGYPTKFYEILDITDLIFCSFSDGEEIQVFENEVCEEVVDVASYETVEVVVVPSGNEGKTGKIFKIYSEDSKPK